MRVTLRQRIVMTLVPVLVLIAGVGGAGVWLLVRLGGSIDDIMRENYPSVIAMLQLNEAVERIDSALQFALVNNPRARTQYEANWALYAAALEEERHTITIHPQEDDLFAALDDLSARYRREGDGFFTEPDAAARTRAYFARDGLLERFNRIKDVSQGILRLNQDNMVKASQDAKATATASVAWFATGLGVVTALMGYLAWRMVEGILRPISAVTQSALAIGHGNLDQVVPVTSSDELGQLASVFNLMGRQLRHYRQTDYARLLRAQRTSQASIDAFPDPVLVIDTEGAVEMANPAAQRLLGVRPHAPTEPSARPWDPPESLRAPVADALRNQKTTLPSGFEGLVTFHGEAGEVSFLPRVVPIRDPYGNSLGAAVSLLDVTRFRLLDRVKSDLVATVSHELKTPLTSVRLAVHLLLEEVVGPLTPKQTELLVDARENAERLLNRINYLLDLARLEHEPGGALDLGPVSVAELLRSSADAARPRAESKGLTLCVEVPPDVPPVDADARRLTHAVGNLLDNAVTYTERGGRVTLSASHAGEAVTIEVRDTGVGIPAEHLPHLFEKFFRVPGTSRGDGTGLGLALVREIVHAHHGEVVCESKPGEGTAFRVTLPVRRAAAEHPVAEASR